MTMHITPIVAALLALALAGCGGGDAADDEGLHPLGLAAAPWCPPADEAAAFVGPLPEACLPQRPPPLPLLAPLPTRPQPITFPVAGQAAG